MGATIFRGYSKQDVIDHVTRFYETDKCVYTTVATYVVDNILWAVVELMAKVDGFRGLPSYGNVRIIACYLLGNESGSGWGYKDLEESMSPYHYSCPLPFLSMAPEKSPEWRTKVRTWHAQHKGLNDGRLIDDRLRVMRIQDAHMLSLEAFASRAKAFQNKNIPRKWTVYFGEAKWKDCYEEIHHDYDQSFVVKKSEPKDSGEEIRRNFDYDQAFSDAETSEEAIRSVHRGAVNNALLAHTPEGRGREFCAFPSPDVLALYPELVEKFPDAFQS